MSKGTIIYIGGFELPDKNAAAHRVLNNAKVLRSLGYNVVFVDVDKQLNYYSIMTDTKRIIQNFECWSVPYPKTNKQWINYLCDIDLIINFMNQYSDIKAVICYNYQAIAFMKIKKYCNKNNIKILADCTEWYSTKGSNIVFKIIKGFDSFLRMRVIQKHMDGVIVISRYLEQYYKNCENVICIPPLVDLSEEKWNIASQDCYSDDKLHFIYAGSPGKDKDKLNFVIECLDELNHISNYTFTIVGITKEQYIKDYLEHEGIIKNLGDRISFRGRVSHRISLDYVKCADFSMFIREKTRMTKAGFPTKYVESISCGTPVITTKTSDLENYIVEGENGFFIDTDDKELSVSVLRKILGMNVVEIRKMKDEYVDSNVFHYTKYIDRVKCVFKNI